MVRLALPLAALLLIGPAHIHADETITSDTVDYCNALAARMAQEDLPPNARQLLLEGQAMCDRGHVMGGLRRIRLAMVIVRGRNLPLSAPP
jgi:hypothetical protein